jgi:glutamyl-Q tRNA(Asp) synthetase
LLTRFAPAPTGWLHLGHVLDAEYVWDRARAAGGRVLLRIEDHDRTRARAEFEAGILDDLDWLGYRPDIFPTDAFRAGRCDGRQSDRDSIYREAFDILRGHGLVYACDCSRRLAAISGAQPSRPAGEPAELRYPGLCRDKHLPLIDGCGWRVRIEPGVEEFEDGRIGLQRQDPEQQCGDVLLRDRHGNWTYQFAVTVDDWRQGVGLRHSRNRSDHVDRASDPPRLPAWPRASAHVLPSSVDPEDPGSEVEQVRWRHRRA